MTSTKSKLLFLVICIVAYAQMSYGQEAIDRNMDELDSNWIVPSEPLSELQEFASWFHQDWELLFSDFHDGAEMYLSNISSVRKRKLRRELEQFIDKNKNANDSELIKEWVNLGAQGWQSDLDIKTTLHNFLKLMEP